MQWARENGPARAQHTYLHVAQSLGKQMRACYTTWDPYVLVKFDPDRRVSARMPCSMVLAA